MLPLAFNMITAFTVRQAGVFPSIIFSSVVFAFCVFWILLRSLSLTNFVCRSQGTSLLTSRQTCSAMSLRLLWKLKIRKKFDLEGNIWKEQYYLSKGSSLISLCLTPSAANVRQRFLISHQHSGELAAYKNRLRWVTLMEWRNTRVHEQTQYLFVLHTDSTADSVEDMQASLISIVHPALLQTFCGWVAGEGLSYSALLPPK